MVHINLSRLISWSPLLALFCSFSLILIAISFEYFGKLEPCQMCLWQRWPHLAVIFLCLFSFFLKRFSYFFLLLAGISALTSASIGLWQTGFEVGLFSGPQSCFDNKIINDISLLDLMKTPLKGCNIVVWSFLGLSMATWNSILSFMIAIFCITFSILKKKVFYE